VGEGEVKLPSLADTIAAVRRELSAAQTAGVGQPVQFRTGPVELEQVATRNIGQLTDFSRSPASGQVTLPVAC
jgi:hypothetical protein